jgi:hypothetical protein
MPSRKVLWLASLAFAATLIWRLPARWAIALLPDGVRCEQPGGTTWSGNCARVTFAGNSVQGLAWQLQARQLWRGRLAARVQLQDPRASGSAELLIGFGGHVRGTELKLKLPIPSPLVRGVPAGLSGVLSADLPSFELQQWAPSAAQGSVQLQNLKQQQPAIDFGSYEWLLADNSWQNGKLSGNLRDLGGPLRLSGTLTLSVAGAYEINARVRSTQPADESYEKALEVLGPADSEGMRTVSVAGTL